MSNPKPESTENPSPPVKGPFTRTITRTYELAPIAVNLKVTETVEASHDVMIVSPDGGCDCHEESTDIPGVPPGTPLVAILDLLQRSFRATPGSGGDPGAGSAPNPGHDRHGPP